MAAPSAILFKLEWSCLFDFWPQERGCQMSPRTFRLFVLSQSDLYVISSSFTFIRLLVGSSSLLTRSILSKTVQIVFDWLNAFDELFKIIQIPIFSWNLYESEKNTNSKKNLAKNISCNIILISAIFSYKDKSIENIILNNDVAQEFENRKNYFWIN